MAKILVSFSSHIFDNGKFQLAIFYDGFLRSLLRCGNEIMAINSADFLPRPWNGNNEIFGNLHKKKIIQDVQNFNPELIIAFNHSIPTVILKNTSCPVALWDADAIQFYNDKDYIKKHLDRYYFLAFSKAGVNNALNFGASQDKTFFVMAATDVYAEEFPQNKNISFIGTNFVAPDAFMQLLTEHGAAKIRPVIDEMNQNFYQDQQGILKKHNAEWMTDYMGVSNLASLSAVQNRITILNNVQELGLTLYGGPDWYNIAHYLPWLAMSYSPERVYSLKHNQDIYNSSKICLNISHSQATDGFPWRVMDIMASNGCLASDRKSGLAEFTKGYVDIPMYDTPYEAYDLCKKLLKDNIWRTDIVKGSQLCIEEKGRWHQRLEQLSQIFGIDMVSEKKSMETVTDTNDYVLQIAIYQSQLSVFVHRLLISFIKLLPSWFVMMVYRIMLSVGFKASYKLLLEAQSNKKKIKKIKRKTDKTVFSIFKKFMVAK